MKFIKKIFLAGILLSSASAYGEKASPTFSQYQIKKSDVFKGKPRPIDLSSHKNAKTYRTKLREATKAGPNFAGHYTVVSIGCGTECQDNWVVNAKTGKIIDCFPSTIGVEYDLNSTLLVIDQPEGIYEYE